MQKLTITNCFPKRFATRVAKAIDQGVNTGDYCRWTRMVPPRFPAVCFFAIGDRSYVLQAKWVTEKVRASVYVNIVDMDTDNVCAEGLVETDEALKVLFSTLRDKYLEPTPAEEQAVIMRDLLDSQRRLEDIQMEMLTAIKSIRL